MTPTSRSTSSATPTADTACDVVVLGAGPAGLSAALTLVRAGFAVTVLEASDRVGGMCVTDHDGPFGFDLGGHILFVRDAPREAWLRELLGPDLHRVERPVACMRDDGIHRGRYFDQHGPVALRPHAPPAPDLPATVFLEEMFGGPPDPDLRRYLEKVDGIPLERITATRARKLLVEQYAPDGFWYPAGGIGQLMDAMARAIEAGGGRVVTGASVSRIATEGGRVRGVSGSAWDGPFTITAGAVVAGVPAGLVATLVPEVAATEAAPLPPRAAAVVSLEVPRPRVSDEAWIQVADARAPFARLSEPGNWSARLAPADRTLVSCEVYCAPDADDPWWALTDEALAAACTDGLVAIGLLDPDETTRLVRVVRRARAWTVVDVDDVERALAPARALDAVAGLTVAQGGDVVLAIEAGERAAQDVAPSITRRRPE